MPTWLGLSYRPSGFDGPRQRVLSPRLVDSLFYIFFIFLNWQRGTTPSACRMIMSGRMGDGSWKLAPRPPKEPGAMETGDEDSEENRVGELGGGNGPDASGSLVYPPDP